MSRLSEFGACGAFAATLVLAGCSGGAGTGGVVPSTANPVQSSQLPVTSASATLTGTVVDLPYDGSASAPGYSVLPSGASATPGAPIAGAAVYVGPQILTALAAPATIPFGYAVAVTDANGRFHMTNAPAGHEAVTIFAAAPHTAIVHRDVALAAGSPAVATYAMTAPTAAETAWLATENEDRAVFSVAPTSLDESVIESARYWAAFMQRNDYFAHCIPSTACDADVSIPDPASYGPQDVDPTHRFYFEHGFSGATEGENIATEFASWDAANAAFMAEQALCPGDTPDNCPFTERTGHFLNIVDASYAWTGFGIDAAAGSVSYYDQDFAEVWQTSPHTTSVTRRQTYAPGLRP